MTPAILGKGTLEMDYWFKQRRFGYGSTPVTWQGWVAVVAFPVICVALALILFVFDAPPGGPGGTRIVLFLVLIAAATLAFVAFVRKKTEGTWRWRWGEDR